jgi:hypothetical protein
MVQGFDAWLHQLRQKRQRWVDASQENGFNRGIWNATVEKYADPTHFIFELLQNAEDTGATRASFRLHDSAIIFEHNGRPFDRSDIEGITGIGNTTKLEEANKIGCFGIGFKSVYVVTERPEVHSTIEGKPIAFSIRDLVVPELIPTSHTATTTQIVLPLPAQQAGDILARVRATLDASGPRSLLFLQSLTRLEWTDGSPVAQCVVEDGADGLRILRTTGTKSAASDRFLVLTRPVRRQNDPQEYSVKLALRLNDGGEIIPEASATRLAVYFETEDVTGLHFQVHGPFRLTDNRANIKREDPWNIHLIGEVSKLFAESLPALRERGFIRRSFLEVMPNATDELPESWQPLLAAVIEAFQKHALIPAHRGGHVAAQDAVRGPSEIRDFLGDEGLAVFGAMSGKRWIGGGMRSSRTDAFLTTLKLPEWGFAEFGAAFQRAFAHAWYGEEKTITANAQAWFDALPDDQVQRFYLLVDAAARAQRRSLSLSHLQFVRLENGSRATPDNALLCPADTTVDEEAAAHGLLLVRSTLTRSGRARGKDVEQFLRKVGVKEIGERDYLAAIIRANYSHGARAPTAEGHLQHMRRFLRWHSASRDCSLLHDVAFLRVEGVEGYHSADTVYLDMPFAQSGLARIYGGRVKGRSRRPLWEGYSKLKRQELLALLKALGVEDALSVEQTRIPYDHPRWGNLFHGFGGSRTTSTETNSDFRIAELPGLIALKDPEVSKMIWKAVAATGPHCMYAHHAPNQTYEANRELSTLALTLQNSAWIPAKDGTLRCPSAITAPELATGLSSVGNDAWLHVIEFGADHRQRSEQHQARRRAAQAIGLPPELADHLGLMPPDAVKSLGNEMLRRIASGAFDEPEFPERTAPNPERRAERLAARTRAAPVKAYEVRSRNLRTSDKDVRQMARPYLRDLYTNRQGDLVCQACHRAMPFRLTDGKHYFEAPELLQSASAELQENHLALCPTCCAKWQNANSTSDDEIASAVQGAEAPEIAVTLAGETARLRFVEEHFEDLRTIFSIVSRNRVKSAG